MRQPKPETIQAYASKLRAGRTPRQAQRYVHHTFGQAEAFRVAAWARQRVLAAAAFEGTLAA